MNHMNNNVRLIGRLGMKTAANYANWRRLSQIYTEDVTLNIKN